MRLAHSLSLCSATLWAAATPWAWAQTAPSADSPAASGAAAANWLNPAAPSLPLQHQSLPASGAVEQASTTWADAHAAVAAFPRGHADVLRWEAVQHASAAQPALDAASRNAMPAQCPMGMAHGAPHSPAGQPANSAPPTAPTAAPAPHGGSH
ncbi:hypothetical protein [Comamonas sp. GB3 AK4-5]|uniref:hypothetical protein n=1 Tax=Comamonas sp. GB3 AK4-5 TaxID=3231487 RepID=UPI00351DB132